MNKNRSNVASEMELIYTHTHTQYAMQRNKDVTTDITVGGDQICNISREGLL